MIFSGIFFGFCNAAFGQHQLVTKTIQQAYEHRQINRESKVLYQLYAGLKPENLPYAFRTGSPGDQPVKCATPYVMEYFQHRAEFSSTTTREIEEIISAPSTREMQSYISESGRFIVHYDTAEIILKDDKNSNNIPDYIEWTAAAADSSWQHEVQTLGFTDPVVSPADPYPIYVEDLGSNGVYGFTSTGGDRQLSGATYIIINSQLHQPAFTKNNDPNPTEGAIKVTVAHELKHAIQYANSRWYSLPDGNNSPHDFDWTEMDATLMEELVYDNVNDYYNYIDDNDSIFKDDNHTVPVAYSGVTWFLYFSENYGPQFWVNAWRRIKQRYDDQQISTFSNHYLSMPEAVKITLNEDYEQDFKTVFPETHLWHIASGDFSPADYGFEERNKYPTPNINFNLSGRDSIGTDHTIPALSADYIEVNALQAITGNLLITITNQDDSQPNNSTSNASLGVLAYFNDGTTDYRTFKSNAHGTISGIIDSWNWGNISKLGVVVANSNADSSTSYRLDISATVPEEITLNQNYPNPFSEQTTLPLALPAAAHVEIKIFDVTGRLIRKLVDEILQAGPNPIPFDAASLASGVYFAQVIIDGKVIIKKMTIIK